METETYKGYTIEYHQDDYSESPREWDNLGTIVSCSRRYNLGEEKVPPYIATIIQPIKTPTIGQSKKNKKKKNKKEIRSKFVDFEKNTIRRKPCTK